MRPRVKKLLWIAPLAILGMVLLAFLGAEIVMLLWNWLLPTVFGIREITFWQALGLLALCRILFGGFGLHDGPRSNVRRRMKERMAERYENMPPEERERFQQRVRERWGLDASGGETSKL